MSLITKFNRCPKGLLHDFKVLADYEKEKWEICRNCAHKVKWNKERKTGRIDNTRYLEVHRRDFLQRTGPTAKLFYAIYKPEEFEANKHKWIIKI